jgi:hypothetical protein
LFLLGFWITISVISLLLGVIRPGGSFANKINPFTFALGTSRSNKAAVQSFIRESGWVLATVCVANHPDSDYPQQGCIDPWIASR